MRFSAFTAAPVPWKNGGGVTRELAVQKENGRQVWRLSLADITRDGAFSAFPGLARIHCIVEGPGHVLSNAETRLEASLLEPLTFDGNLALDCRLRGGACKAFNVIYDPELVAAQARVLRDGKLPEVTGSQVFFVVSGSLDLSEQGRYGPGEGQATDGATCGAVSGGGAVIHVWFQPV
ncbi:hypothetical protein AB838_11555 [Rhodobacteraceae bacterium (ex Bugula neritina AB1)]|nr:hypothetical protein AB838_11555 [Rhodobacteraceae bacterium (ex Bugula neritina AB1)]